MTNRKVQFFNMIEVLLALTVIAIGMTSVLGLFPVGLNASRNAIAQNCSADVADQLITYLRVTNEINQDQYANAFYRDDSSIPNYPFTDSTGIEITNGSFTNNPENSKEVNVDDNSIIFLNAYKNERIEDSGTYINKLVTGKTVDFVRVAPSWSIFKQDKLDGKPRVFFIIQGHNSNQNDVLGSTDKISRTVDYSAMALVWKSTVQIWRDHPDGTSGWSQWPDLSGATTDEERYQYSGKLNIELSWPLELPYKERKKRYYQIIINKPGS